jgi:hypothetical protein
MEPIDVLIIILIVLCLVYIAYKYTHLVRRNKNLKNHIIKNSTPQQIATPVSPPIIPTQPQVIPPPVGLMLKDYDERTIYDPLTPPFKRDDYMIPAVVSRPDLYGAYTSGAPGVFHKMGYLKNESSNDYKFLTLIGRPKYNGSTLYEYYVTSTNKDDTIKLYLENVKRELYTGDKVKVHGLEGEYSVIVDKVLDFEYNPLVL